MASSALNDAKGLSRHDGNVTPRKMRVNKSGPTTRSPRDGKSPSCRKSVAPVDPPEKEEAVSNSNSANSVLRQPQQHGTLTPTKQSPCVIKKTVTTYSYQAKSSSIRSKITKSSSPAAKKDETRERPNGRIESGNGSAIPISPIVSKKKLKISSIPRYSPSPKAKASTKAGEPNGIAVSPILRRTTYSPTGKKTAATHRSHIKKRDKTASQTAGDRKSVQFTLPEATVQTDNIEERTAGNRDAVIDDGRKKGDAIVAPSNPFASIIANSVSADEASAPSFQKPPRLRMDDKKSHSDRPVSQDCASAKKEGFVPMERDDERTDGRVDGNDDECSQSSGEFCFDVSSSSEDESHGDDYDAFFQKNVPTKQRAASVNIPNPKTRVFTFSKAGTKSAPSQDISESYEDDINDDGVFFRSQYGEETASTPPMPNPTTPRASGGVGFLEMTPMHDRYESSTKSDHHVNCDTPLSLFETPARHEAFENTSEANGDEHLKEDAIFFTAADRDAILSGNVIESPICEADGDIVPNTIQNVSQEDMNESELSIETMNSSLAESTDTAVEDFREIVQDVIGQLGQQLDGLFGQNTGYVHQKEGNDGNWLLDNRVSSVQSTMKKSLGMLADQTDAMLQLVKIVGERNDALEKQNKSLMARERLNTCETGKKITTEAGSSFVSDEINVACPSVTSDCHEEYSSDTEVTFSSPSGAQMSNCNLYSTRKYPPIQKTLGTEFVTELSEFMEMEEGHHAYIADLLDRQWATQGGVDMCFD